MLFRSVSREVYNKMKDSSESLSKVLAEKELHVQHLTERIQNLELIIKKDFLEERPASEMWRKENKSYKENDRKSRDVLLTMKKVHQPKFPKGRSKINNRSPLGARSGNIPSHSSSFMSVGGKENI